MLVVAVVGFLMQPNSRITIMDASSFISAFIFYATPTNGKHWKAGVDVLSRHFNFLFFMVHVNHVLPLFCNQQRGVVNRTFSHIISTMSCSLFGDSELLPQHLHPAWNNCFCSASWICVVSSFGPSRLQLLLMWVQFPVELPPDRDTVFSSSNPGNPDL